MFLSLNSYFKINHILFIDFQYFQFRKSMVAEEICLCKSSYKERVNQYLKRQTSDLYLVIEDRLYPAHKQFLTESKYLVEQYSNMQSIICVIDKLLDIQNFEKVLGFMYGLNITCKRDWEIIKLLQVSEAMATQTLTEMLFQDIERNFDDYCIFVLFSVASKFNAKWLKKICMERFLQMEFEQISYKRFKFIQCEKQIAEQILNFAVKFQRERKHNFKFHFFKQIINQYNRQSQNGAQININILFVPKQDIITQTNSEYQKSSVNTNKKYKSVLKGNIDTENEGAKMTPFQIEQMDHQSLESCYLYDSIRSKQNNVYSNNKQPLNHQDQRKPSISSFQHRKLSFCSFATPYQQQNLTKSSSFQKQKQINQNTIILKNLPKFSDKKQRKLKRMNTINFFINQKQQLRKQKSSIFYMESIL